MGNLLVASQGNDYTKRDGFSTSVLTTLTQESNYVRGCTWDGTNLITRTWNTTSGDTNTFRLHSGFTNTVTSSFTASSLGTYAKGITWDGTNLIVAASTSIVKYTGFTNTVLATIASPAGDCRGVSWDPATGNLLSVDYTSRKLYVHSGFSTTILSTIDLGTYRPIDVERATDSDVTYVSTTTLYLKLTGISATVADSISGSEDGLSCDDRYTPSAPSSPTLNSPISDFVTTDTTPDFSWTHNDVNGDAQNARTIDLETAAGVAETGYPAAASTSSQTHTSTATLIATPATRYRWRVKTSDAVSGYGPYSDYAYFYVATAATVAISSPADAGTLTSPAFTVTWGAISGGSAVQASYRVTVTKDGVTYYDSGTVSGTATSQAVPSSAGLVNGESYVITLTCVDTIGQTCSDTATVTADWITPTIVQGLVLTPIGGT